MSSVFRTRFNYKLYFLLLLVLPFLLGLYAGISTLLDNIKSGNYFDDFGLTIVMPVLVISFICYTFYFYISKSPQIEIDGKGIRIGNESIDFAEIEKIRVRSKHTTYFLIMSYDYVEASSIVLKTGTEYTIFVEHYWNGSLIRTNLSNLSNFLKGQTSSFRVSTTTFTQEESLQFYLEDFQEYRQPPYKFANYYIFSPLVLLLIYVAIFLEAPFILRGIFLVLALAFYFILVRQSHYFLLGENHLIVKNYLFPWWRKPFLIKGINHVTTETQPKQETALKVITTDFRIHRFQSGLMNDSMFSRLINAIKAKRKAKLGVSTQV